MIGGNIKAVLENKTTIPNAIGEDVAVWTKYDELKGFLDLMGGSADIQNFNAKIQESTHLFICDYKPIEVKEVESRLVINNEVYEITMFDNPMGLNEHLEFYLKYTGE